MNPYEPQEEFKKFVRKLDYESKYRSPALLGIRRCLDPFWFAIGITAYFGGGEVYWLIFSGIAFGTVLTDIVSTIIIDILLANEEQK